MGSTSRAWPSSLRTCLASPAFVLATLAIASPPAAAQPIAVLGYADVAGIGPLQLVGDRGFSFGSGVSESENLMGISSCNFSPGDCVPGATVSLRLFAAGTPGTATLDGVTYDGVGGAFG